MNMEAQCVVSAVKVSLPKLDIWEYVKADITHAPSELPLGPYEVSFEGRKMRVNKTADGWIAGRGVMSRTELKIDYGERMKPISAICTACGEKMLTPPADLENSADIIVWFSEKYVEHRRLKHSQDDRRRVPRD